MAEIDDKYVEGIFATYYLNPFLDIVLTKKVWRTFGNMDGFFSFILLLHNKIHKNDCREIYDHSI